MKILLVEDDTSLGYILKEYLAMSGYAVQLAIDGEQGLALYQSQPFDLCILDVMMPKKDGFSLAADIRALDKQIPIIFLTAKSLKVDKLKGFNLGADDYIVKPVDEEELAARIRAITKRINPIETSSISQFKIGKYSFDYINQRLSINDEVIQMTQMESDILKALCENQGNILDRNKTLKSLWGESDYFNRRSMDVFISRLRKYLEKDKSIKIQNVRGKGFILDVK